MDERKSIVALLDAHHGAPKKPTIQGVVDAIKAAVEPLEDRLCQLEGHTHGWHKKDIGAGWETVVGPPKYKEEKQACPNCGAKL